MNHASDTSVGLRNTNGATLDLPFLKASAVCRLGLDGLVCVSWVLVDAATAGAFPSAESNERLGPYALSNRRVPAVPVGATFSPQLGGIAAVCTT